MTVSPSATAGSQLERAPARPPHARREGVRGVDAKISLCMDHESVTGGGLPPSEGSARSAPPCAPTPMFIPTQTAGSVIRSELIVPDGQPQVFIVGNAPSQRGIAFR